MVKPVNFLLGVVESCEGGHEHWAAREMGNLHLSFPFLGSPHLSNEGLGLKRSVVLSLRFCGHR